MQRTFAHARKTDDTAHGLSGYSPLLTTLLLNRGITEPTEAATFLKPSYERDMHDPLLLHDMQKAIGRIHGAVASGEKIVVYADYDCDGIPGAVIMHDFFERIGYKNASIYIPDRHDEGYGLNPDAVQKFIDDGVTLVMTIDLGTSDHDDIAFAQRSGVDVIVTDHHIPHATLPGAFAIVNPKIGDTYPEKMLCGSGVVFKLVQAYLNAYGTESLVTPGWEKWLLDMAGLATLSDMVPLVGENRTIASFGMQVLRKSPRPGLVQLLRTLKIDQRYLVEEDLTFMVTPRINAASRMDSPMRAFEMLSEKDTVKAGALAAHLTSINDVRKQLVATIMKDVKAKLAERELGPVIVIGNPSWRIGVLGLVAGKICDEYDRPAFVWGREGSDDESMVKGSCRSNGSANVVELMEAAHIAFRDFGGHELAGGFSVESGSIHHLEERLHAAFESVKREGGAVPGMIDATLSLSDVSEETCRMLTQLAPFGLGNPKPTFLFPNLTVRSIKMFGKEKNHIELTLCEESGRECVAISFFADADSFTKKIQQGDKVDMIGTLEKSYFAGRQTVRVRIVDVT